jgi:DNA polymerase delta subunit 2
LYIIGNQPRFETSVVHLEGNVTRVVLLPKFSETGQVVLVNQGTLEVKVLDFSDGFFVGGEDVSMKGDKKEEDMDMHA